MSWLYKDQLTNSDENTNWTNLLKILKSDEKDNTYFTLLTNYNEFKWNIIHFE